MPWILAIKEYQCRSSNLFARNVGHRLRSLCAAQVQWMKYPVLIVIALWSLSRSQHSPHRSQDRLVPSQVFQQHLAAVEVFEGFSQHRPCVDKVINQV